MTLKNVEQLIDAPYNPREITPTALCGLSNSLTEFGDLSGIVWNKRTGHVVCGHQRLRALRERHGDSLRIEDDVIITPDDDRYSVRIVDWDDAHEKTANVTANNPHIAGTFLPQVAQVLGEIASDLPELYDSLCLSDVGEDVGMFAGIAEAEQPDLTDGERPDLRQMTFTLHVDQQEIVEEAIKSAKLDGGDVSDDNPNKNGNALAYICGRYLND